MLDRLQGSFSHTVGGGKGGRGGGLGALLCNPPGTHSGGRVLLDWARVDLS